MIINKKIYKALSRVFLRLCLLRRWTSDITDSKYDELAKQAINGIITFFLACEEEHAGKSVHWENFPKIALYRCFQKAYTLADVSEGEVKSICNTGGIPMEKVALATSQIIQKKTEKEFCEKLEKAMCSNEVRIFKAATSIATYIELSENRHNFNGGYEDKAKSIVESMRDYMDISGFEKYSSEYSPMFCMLKTISRLRNQSRWIIYARPIDCSVLGHLMDTAIFAYLMSLEENPEDEIRATQMFFLGLFHDIPEAWTKDIPSPIKDTIEGFRDATEVFELDMVEKNMYSLLPEYVVEKVKKVMMEDEKNSKYKTFMKGADYLSASDECFRQIIGGTRDFNFYRAAVGLEQSLESGKARLTQQAYVFYKEIVESIEKVKDSMIFYEEEE